MASKAMGIFDDKPIRTKALMVEERQGKLTLIPISDRGAPATERTNEKRKARYFEVPAYAPPATPSTPMRFAPFASSARKPN
jgi:hypothetical protein